MNTQTSLERRLQYQFNDSQLLDLALTHRSRGAKNYERLEFLGDSILGFVVAEWLYLQFPGLNEGPLSRIRASLVRKETLAKVARELQLGEFLLLGEGELKSGGFNRDSILADTVESLIGAIFLDADFNAAKDFIYRNFSPHFETVTTQASFKDSKSQLQELLQKYSLPLPQYEIIDSSGEDHELEFTIRCSLSTLGLNAEASAKSRRIAEQKAAATLLFDMELEKMLKQQRREKKI